MVATGGSFTWRPICIICLWRRNACDTAVTVRVLHHVADVPAALREIASAVRPGGTYVLEYANKRNLKSIARYLGRRQAWSPFAPEPYEFVASELRFSSGLDVGCPGPDRVSSQ